MLSISKMASMVRNPERVVGMHFFNPPEAMKLVEIVEGEETSEGTKDAAVSFAKSVGKEPVIAKDSPGFIVNRISVPVLNEALKVLDEGIASKEDIDKAMTLGMNYPVGPIALADYVGLDVSLAALQTLEREFGEHYKPSDTLVKLVEEGKLGMKTGEGFYKY
jgi:3-hydroxybutyryl-CoA dehydrogenase